MSSLAWHSIQAPARSQQQHSSASSIPVTARFTIDEPKLYYDIQDEFTGSVEIMYHPNRTHKTRTKIKTPSPSFIKFSKIDLLFQGQEIINFNGVYSNHNLKRKFSNVRQILPDSELAQFDVLRPAADNNNNNNPPQYILAEGKTYTLKFKFRISPFLDTSSCKSQADLHLRLPPSTNRLVPLAESDNHETDSFQPIKIHYRLNLVCYDLAGAEMFHRYSKLINVLPVSYHGITTLPNLKQYHHNDKAKGKKAIDDEAIALKATSTDLMYRYNVDPELLTPVITTETEVMAIPTSSVTTPSRKKPVAVSYSYRLGFLYGKKAPPEPPQVDILPPQPTNSIMGRLHLQLNSEFEFWFDYNGGAADNTSLDSNNMALPSPRQQLLPISLMYIPTASADSNDLPVVTRVRTTLDSLTSVSVHHNDNHDDIYYYEKNDQYIFPLYSAGAPTVPAGQKPPTSSEIKIMKQNILLGDYSTPASSSSSSSSSSSPISPGWTELMEGTNTFLQRLEIPIDLQPVSTTSGNLLFSLIPSYQACYSSRVYVLNINLYYTMNVAGSGGDVSSTTERCIKLKVPINIIALSQWKLKLFIANASKTLDERHRAGVNPPEYDSSSPIDNNNNNNNTGVRSSINNSTPIPTTAHEALFGDLDNLGLSDHDDLNDDDDSDFTTTGARTMPTTPIYSTLPAANEIDLSKLQLLRNQQHRLSSSSSVHSSSSSLVALSESFLSSAPPSLLNCPSPMASSPRLIPSYGHSHGHGQSTSSSLVLSHKSHLGFRRGGGGGSIDANLNNILQYLSPQSDALPIDGLVQAEDEDSPPIYTN